MDNKEGVWRTIRGRRVFIAKGESLGQAMSKSGKFKREDIREGKQGLRRADRVEKTLQKPNDTKLRRKMTNKGNRYERDVFENRQAEKNRINEQAPVFEKGKTRLERNALRYSNTDRQEIKHEQLQKKLADYKAKKQSNNKINQFESKRVAENEIAEKGYKYYSSHGADIGTLPKDVKVADTQRYDDGMTSFKTDRPLTTEELKKYDIKDETRNSYYDEKYSKQSNNKVENIHSLIEKNIERDKKLHKEGRTYDDYKLEQRTNGKFKSFDNLDKEIDKQSNNKIEDLKQKALNSKPNLYEQIHNEPTKEEMDYAIAKSNNIFQPTKEDLKEMQTYDRANDIRPELSNNKIEIKNNNGELTGYTENERIEYHHSGDTGLMASVFSTGEDDLLHGHFFNIPKEYQEGNKLKEYSLKEVERLKSDRKAYLERQKAGIPEESKYVNQKKEKQSNNKVESEYDLYKRAKEHPETIDPMTENSTDWEALEKKYGNNEKKWEVKSTGGFGQQYGEGNIPIRDGKVDYESHFGALAQDLTLLSDKELKTALETQQKMYDKYSNQPKTYDARTRNGRMSKIIHESELTDAKLSVKALEKETLRRRYEGLENYEIYNEGDKFLRDSNRPTDLKYEVDKIMRRIDNANKRGSGYDNKATNDLKKFLIENNDKVKSKEEIKREKEIIKMFKQRKGK